MCNFVEGYLMNPSQAIMNARISAELKFRQFEIDDEVIFSQISSPEFRLYEEIVI